MKTILAVIFALLMLVPAGARAADRLVYESQGMRIVLTTEACTDKDVLATIPEGVPSEVSAKFRRAEVMFNGKAYKACWLPVSGNMVFVFDEAGDGGEIPMTMFKKPETI